MTPCNRTHFTPQRGASMAAQHATGEQVLASQSRCAQLGVCQSQQPACEGCSPRPALTRLERNCQALGNCQFNIPACRGCISRGYSFAPGVIDHGRKRGWLGLDTPYAFSKLAVACALTGLAAGYVARMMGWV